jgi:8-oxo-dGTP diphosphatase
MTERDVRAAGLRLFGRLPSWLRRSLVRAGSTAYTVGCVAVIEDAGRVLLLRQSHRPDLSLPGGLLRRGESPAGCVTREVAEELGTAVPFAAHPDAVLVNGDARRIDLIFTASARVEVTPSPDGEVLAGRWMAPQDVPASSPAARVLAALAAGR